jgi:hypothetical protein
MASAIHIIIEEKDGPKVFSRFANLKVAVEVGERTPGDDSEHSN